MSFSFGKESQNIYWIKIVPCLLKSQYFQNNRTSLLHFHLTHVPIETIPKRLGNNYFYYF